MIFIQGYYPELYEWVQCNHKSTEKWKSWEEGEKGDKNMRIWLDASEFKDEGIGL